MSSALYNDYYFIKVLPRLLAVAVMGHQHWGAILVVFFCNAKVLINIYLTK